VAKIAFSTSGENQDALLDTRFGRCKNFIIYDVEQNQLSVVENTQNMEAAQGAGIQSAQNVIEHGADVLISGHCGPKAFRVLSAAGIAIYLGDSKPIHELIEDYKQGRLKKADSADVEGHWL
jgi:predicted Fe-Mo cluster-binding NifX family protein